MTAMEKMYALPQTLNFACPHLSISYVEAVRCFICGPLIGVPAKSATYTVTTTGSAYTTETRT